MGKGPVSQTRSKRIRTRWAANVGAWRAMPLRLLGLGGQTVIESRRQQAIYPK